MQKHNSLQLQTVNIYPELEQFKQSVQDTGAVFLRPYEQYRRSAWAYRMIFIFLSLLFGTIFFYLIIKQQYSSLNLVLFNENNFFLVFKGSLGFLCAFFSLISLKIALSINANKEAIKHSWQKAKQRITQLYVKKRSRLGLIRFLHFLFPSKVPAIVTAYQDAIEHLHLSCERAAELLDLIGMTEHLTKEERIALCNQALLQLRDELQAIIHQHTYKSH